MSDIAIKVEKLGKRYRIGQFVRYRTLRESLMGALAAPFRALRSNNSPDKTIWALKDVSFEIKQGEVVGIIGRNGAGKSTLLKVLTRITEPTEGYAEIRGRVGSLLEVGTGFHPELTGRENIYFNGAVLGMRKKEIERKFDEIVDFSGVQKFIDTPLKRYSSGMQVRLAFAVAAHLEPDILFVDEVLAVGDAEFQKKSLGKMGEIAQGGRTVLFVSHNMTAVLGLCTRAIWLHAGEVARQGETREVVSHYLHDVKVPLGEIIFAPAESTPEVELKRAYVTDADLNIRPDVPYASPFYVAVEYKVTAQIDKLRVGFRLHNERNLPVLHTATSDCHELDAVVGTVGFHRVKVQIPGAWLAPGRYYVELGVWSPSVGHHHYSSDALAFEVTPSALVDSMGDEVLRPVLQWEAA